MFSLIVAHGNDRVIAKDGVMPWHLPNDLAYFREKTQGGVVLMGRKTFESIGRALPDRLNIVLTSDAHFKAEGVQVVRDLADILRLAVEYPDIFVIGGGEVYRLMLPLADMLFVTRIRHDFEGDTFFPPINPHRWQVLSSEEGVQDSQNAYPHSFSVLKRIR